jgi:FkbM family methyltransferase
MKSLARALLRVLNRITFDQRLKTWLRLAVLRARSFIPLELLVDPGDWIVQVGTPSVATIDRLSRLVGNAGRAIVIEPEPANVERLRTHIGERSLANVILVPKGVWKRRARHTLLIAPRPADHRLELDAIVHDNDLRAGGYVGSRVIDVDTLDNILDDLGVSCELGLVKITINGAEADALEGAPKTLDRTRRLWVKAHARRRDTGQPLSREIVARLEGHQFRTVVTKPTRSVAEAWGAREGDVFAWKE